jgi:hypothetical protein
MGGQSGNGRGGRPSRASRGPLRSEVNSRAITDADWARLCRCVELPPTARKDLETIIQNHGAPWRHWRPPNRSDLRSSLLKVAGDARRLATSIGQLSSRAKVIINLIHEDHPVENLRLFETLVGSESGFLREIVEKITLLEQCANNGAAAKRSLESKTIPTFLFVLDVDELLLKHVGKGVARPSEKSLLKKGSTYPFVCEVCKIAGIKAGIDDALKRMIKMKANASSGKKRA